MRARHPHGSVCWRTAAALFAGLCIVVATLSASPAAVAQTSWPPPTIKFVVPFPAGGNADAIARLVADRLAQALRTTIVIENRGGAAGAIGTQAVARAEADGATFLFAPSSVLVIGPHIRKAGYDAMTDFVPVAVASGSYGIVAVRSDLPVTTLKEFVELAAREPGKLNFGSAGYASSTHLAGEIFHAAAGIKLVHVAYKGSADALTDLLGGRLDVIYDPVAFPQVQAGKVKALAIMGETPHPELPGVKTATEQGYPVISNVFFGLFAPKGTPPAIVDALADATGKVLAAPDMPAAVLKFSQYVNFKGPRAAAEQVAADDRFFKELIERLNIKEN